MPIQRKEVTEYDNYEYEFVGKDTPELRSQAAAAREDAIRFAEELANKYSNREV